MRFALGASFGLAVALLVGCSKQTPSPLGERHVVKGKVTTGGKPVTKGTLVLTPVDPAKGDEQTGDLKASGEYVTSVFPGKYKVSVVDNQSVPAAARSPKTTTLEIDIPAGGKNGADFDLK